jgi:hypothetical protein
MDYLGRQEKGGTNKYKQQLLSHTMSYSSTVYTVVPPLSAAKHATQRERHPAPKIEVAVIVLWVKDPPKDVQWVRTRERCNHSVISPTKTTKRGMDDMEEIPGVYVDFTNTTCTESAPGEMESGITQDPLAIS